jgi:hypothetical protein
MPDYGERDKRVDLDEFMDDITNDQLIRYFLEFNPKYNGNNLYDMYDNEPIWELGLGFIENEPRIIKVLKQILWNHKI